MNFVEIVDFDYNDWYWNSVLLDQIKNWLKRLYYCFFLYIYYILAKEDDLHIEENYKDILRKFEAQFARNLRTPRLRLILLVLIKKKEFIPFIMVGHRVVFVCHWLSLYAFDLPCPKHRTIESRRYSRSPVDTTACECLETLDSSLIFRRRRLRRFSLSLSLLPIHVFIHPSVCSSICPSSIHPSLLPYLSNHLSFPPTVYPTVSLLILKSMHLYCSAHLGDYFRNLLLASRLFERALAKKNRLDGRSRRTE